MSICDLIEGCFHHLELGKKLLADGPGIGFRLEKLANGKAMA